MFRRETPVEDESFGSADPRVRPVTVTYPGRAATEASAPPARSQDTGSDDASDSFIGAGTVCEGTFHSGPLRIHGRVEGEVVSTGDVAIEASAHVVATVTAPQVRIAGSVDGQVQGAQRVEITRTGRVTGEIRAGALVMEEGAVVEGQLHMGSTQASFGRQPTSAEHPRPAGVANVSDRAGRSRSERRGQTTTNDSQDDAQAVGDASAAPTDAKGRLPEASGLAQTLDTD
jgi:cytoskeletal protein CcmA (bactofilin family)